MKDFGESEKFLKEEIIWDWSQKTLFIFQERYLTSVLDLFSMKVACGRLRPMDQIHDL